MTLTAPVRPPAVRPARRVSVTPARTSLWRRLDWLLLLPVLALTVIGALLVWSATLHRDDLTGGREAAYAIKHAINAGIGGVLGFVVAATDHRWVRILTPAVYVGAVLGLALIFVPGIGVELNGSLSWISLGGLTIQPAELAKLAVVVTLALIVAERVEGRRTRAHGGTADDALHDLDVVLLLAVAALPAALILLQPDLGTLLVLCATFFGMLAVAGAPKRWLLGLVVAGAVTAAVVLELGLLAGYQSDRFLAFADPSLDPLGAGYNTTQARIAIGNGGVFGQGLFDGSQTQSGFVPEQHTDFIFTVAGEELGMVGAGLVIALFGLLLWRGLRVALQAEDIFGRLAAAGIVCWFGFQAFQNIGMCLGIMPVTGVPLPLVSYGGTSMFASLMAVGLLVNISLRTDHRLGLGAVVRSTVARSAA